MQPSLAGTSRTFFTGNVDKLDGFLSAAANAAGIPSVLITNFSFDSVFSYLSTPFVDSTESFDSLQPIPSTKPLLPPDLPIPIEELQPLVEQLRQGYRCADLLLRLPGNIPMPSFSMIPDLPSQDWVDRRTMAFTPEVTKHLLDTPSSYALWSQVPFPPDYPAKRLPRSVVNAPLLVRSPDPSVYTPEGRSRLLSSLGVPVDRHDPATTKILIVSFGGQVFHKPHSHSRSPSASGTPRPAVLTPSTLMNGVTPPKDVLDRKAKSLLTRKDPGSVVDDLSDALRNNLVTSLNHGSPRVVQDRSHGTSKLIIPGAPPASIPNSPMAASNPMFNTIPPTPRADSTTTFPDIEEATGDEDIGRLLPDDSWIAIVCGVSKDWAKEDGEELPDSFYVAPKYVYMPDLTAAADVLLGKLGYGTVSECVDACTPFVYVSRPLFIEEHGLRLLLDKDGVGVELSRDSYEAGNWADAVESAYEKGKAAKALKRQEGETGKRVAEGKEMATYLIDWVKRWNDLDLHD
ncbi:hypothetical protein EIP86_008403 [Pleurotus ostreatoroseus]|nr:hypothetical protein EIP86_008403 [Pleurotus ostreatoroseus]